MDDQETRSYWTRLLKQNDIIIMQNEKLLELMNEPIEDEEEQEEEDEEVKQNERRTKATRKEE